MVGAGVLALPTVAAPSGFLPSSTALIGIWIYMAATGMLISGMLTCIIPPRKELLLTNSINYQFLQYRGNNQYRVRIGTTKWYFHPLPKPSHPRHRGRHCNRIILRTAPLRNFNGIRITRWLSTSQYSRNNLNQLTRKYPRNIASPRGATVCGYNRWGDVCALLQTHRKHQ